MFGWNGIITAASPRMASQNSFKSQPESFKDPMNPKRLNHIMRTGRFVTAVFGK
jgi:hypothetical protein